MNSIKQNFRRLKYRLKQKMTVSRVLFLLFTVALLAWTYGAIMSLSRNWQLEQRLISKRREVKVLELEVDNLELENQYYASEEYQELAAREKGNKLFPGETLVYLPENSAEAKEKSMMSKKTTITYSEPSNFRQWLSFLFGV